jgi:hypothetical protein
LRYSTTRIKTKIEQIFKIIVFAFSVEILNHKCALLAREEECECSVVQAYHSRGLVEEQELFVYRQPCKRKNTLVRGRTH